MRKIALWEGALVGLLTGLVLVALAYLGFRLFGLPFIPFDLFDWMTRHLPGRLVTSGIDAMIAIIGVLRLGQTSVVAKTAEQALAIAQFLLGGAVFGAALAALARRSRQLVALAQIIGGALALGAILVELSLGFPQPGAFASSLWLAALFVGWGWLSARLLPALHPPAEEPAGADRERRRFLYLVGAGSFTVLVSALGVSLIRQKEPLQPQTPAEAEISAANTSGPAQSPPAALLAGRIPAVPGTRPEVTGNDRFYRVDINAIPPNIDAGQWRLEISGLVERPQALTLEDIRARPAVSQAITLECISNPVGGDLISTSRWTGIQLKALLEELGLQPGARALYIQSIDGYYETVAMADLMNERTLLVYEMNGQPLPVEHGYPLRIYIPNRFGMKQPKWIQKMEVTGEERSGYWVDRGWSREAIVQTTSVIDKLEQTSAQASVVWVGGIAYAGARGIRKVEVQVDDGPWQAAKLRNPPLSPLTWVQWRYSWPARTGRHIFRVRAYDGSGALQTTQAGDPYPNGATGIDTLTDNFL